MPELIVLVGPMGSGKSTLAETYQGYIYINQDTQGKEGHLKQFARAVLTGNNIIVDRINHTKLGRARYLQVAKTAGYTTKIIVLHESYDTCIARCNARTNHATIKDGATAIRALNMFFSKYERPQLDEADIVEYRYPEGNKQKCCVIDLDGSLCDIQHRLHFIEKEGKKDWKSFFEEIPQDKVNEWCYEIIYRFEGPFKIIYCSGRPDNYRKLTEDWLINKGIVIENDFTLFMRNRSDRREDYIIKENILDFEILTRYEPFFFVDDRKQVVDMWRKRGYTCLQCAEGDF